MIGLRLTVPIACWRRGAARSYWETEPLPPPSTVYGSLLSLVGELDRERHAGCRLTAGLVRAPAISTVLRKVWRVKDKKVAPGQGVNAVPEYQELAVDSELIVWIDSSNEPGNPSLEQRIRSTFGGDVGPRFGGWSLGESTHLINDAWPIEPESWTDPARVFVIREPGELSLPVWVDHVGAAGTQRVIGSLIEMSKAPSFDEMPVIAAERR
ncbi:MAG: type I-MYXAN CRISPR-associated protein Cas5/Cmx5/DevS [Myxococcota bacterium]